MHQWFKVEVNRYLLLTLYVSNDDLHLKLKTIETIFKFIDWFQKQKQSIINRVK